MRSHASHRAGPIRERQLLVCLLERERPLGQRTVNAVDPRKGERQKQRNHTAAGSKNKDALLKQAVVQLGDVRKRLCSVEKKLDHAEQFVLLCHVDGQNDLPDSQRLPDRQLLKQRFPKNILNRECIVQHADRCKGTSHLQLAGRQAAFGDVLGGGHKKVAVRRVKPYPHRAAQLSDSAIDGQLVERVIHKQDLGRLRHHHLMHQ